MGHSDTGEEEERERVWLSLSLVMFCWSSHTNGSMAFNCNRVYLPATTLDRKHEKRMGDTQSNKNRNGDLKWDLMNWGSRQQQAHHVDQWIASGGLIPSQDPSIGHQLMDTYSCEVCLWDQGKSSNHQSIGAPLSHVGQTECCVAGVLGLN